MSPAVSFDKDYAVAGLKEYFASPGLVAAIDALKAEGFKFGLIFTLIKEGVLVMEKLAMEADAVGTGAVKKDALVSYIDGCVKLWGPLELIDGPLIGQAIDALVLWYNTVHGHDWYVKVSAKF